MILKCLLNGHFKAILICCFVLINITASKSISSNESSQVPTSVPTSTDANDLGPTTEIYPNTAATVDVTTNSDVATETGNPNVVGDSAATTPSTVETTPDVYFDEALTDSLPMISTTDKTSILKEVNTVLDQPSARIDTPIPHIETYTQPEPTLAKDAQVYPYAPQEPAMDVLNPGAFTTDPIVQQYPNDGFISTTQDTSLLQDVNGVQQYPAAQIDAPLSQTYSQPGDAQFYQNVPQEPVMDFLNSGALPTDPLFPNTQDTSLLQDVNGFQQYPSDPRSSINAPQDPLIDPLNPEVYAAEPLVQQYPTDPLIPNTQDTSLLQDVNAVQHHPPAPRDDALPGVDDAVTNTGSAYNRDESFFQWGSDVMYHPSDVGSSSNAPQEPLVDLSNSATFAAEPLVQHFPSEAISPVDDSVPKSQPNFTDAITIPDETHKRIVSSPPMMYDNVYDDYGGELAYDDHLSDDYPAMDETPEPEEGNYGLEELNESDLEQMDDNDLQELEDVLASSEQSDDKYDDFEESNLPAGETTNDRYSGVFDDFEEMTPSKHIPFKIPKHHNYLKTLKNLKQYTNSKGYGYTQKSNFGREEAEDDIEDRMSIFNTQTPGQPRKRLYNDRLVALLDIYNRNAKRRNLRVRAKQPTGPQLKYDSKALLQTYDALMQIKHRKMGGKGKYVKSYKSKGNRSKQIRRLQRIRRLMSLASKRKTGKSKAGAKSGPQIALSTIANAVQSAVNDVPMLSLSSLQNGIKTRFQHPNEPTNPMDNGVLNQINQAMYYHPDDLASPQYHPDAATTSSFSTMPPNPFLIPENQNQRPPVPRFMEYDEVEEEEYEAPETDTEAEGDEGEDDFLNNLFGLSTGKRGNGQGSGYQNNADLYGSCPAVPVRVSGSKITVTTSEGCQVVISISGSTEGDGKNLGINVSYNNKVIV